MLNCHTHSRHLAFIQDPALLTWRPCIPPASKWDQRLFGAGFYSRKYRKTWASISDRQLAACMLAQWLSQVVPFYVVWLTYQNIKFIWMLIWGSIDTEFWADLQWCATFLGICYISSLQMSYWCQAGVWCLWLLGMWSLFREQVVCSPMVFLSFLGRMHISVQELLPIVIACVMGGGEIASSHIRCLCDNAAVVVMINKHTSKDLMAIYLLRCLFFICAQFNITLSAEHVAGIRNEAADALSRNNYQPSRRFLLPIEPHQWYLLL